MLILSEKKLIEDMFSPDVQLVTVTERNVEKFNGDGRVAVIVGSRALAKKCADLDFPSLKLFQLTSAGFDGVPVDQYAQQGVAVANAGSVYSVPIAETVVFGMLQMAKRFRPNPNDRRVKLWRHYNTITELSEKTALIMGAGNIGTAVAERLKPFQMDIDGYDLYCAPKAPYSRILRSREELMAEIGKYDYIISTLPDNEQTRGFIDRELISCISKCAVIVNVGRMTVFERDALYSALKAGGIGGAVLDMFEKIPNPLSNPFRRLKNVVVLPGVAAISQETNERLAAHMTRNAIAAMTAGEIRNVINGVG